MIVAMKKITLLTLASEREEALKRLRALGVMQIVPAEKNSASTQHCAEAADRCARAISALKRLPAAETPAATDSGDPEELLASALKLLEKRGELETGKENLRQKLLRLAPWGNFDRKLLDELRNKGISVWLCAGSEEEFARAAEIPNLTLCVLEKNKNALRFVALSYDDPMEEFLAGLPLFRLNDDDDPAALKRSLAATGEALDANLAALQKLLPRLPELSRHYEYLTGKTEFSAAADAMEEHGIVAALQGFVPVTGVEALRSEAQANGWGLLIEEPGEEENVPVLIAENRFTRLIRPLFDFLGIVPGYREIDVSGGVLIFFTLFYAMIVGDAGYGLVFTLIAIVADRLLKNKPQAKLPLRLFMLLSVSAMIWGALCGSWFGLEHIPGTNRPFPALEALRDFATNPGNQSNVQCICFILAVLQLTSGRIWKSIHERSLRSAGENIGWALIIWGNFLLTVRLLVYPGEFPHLMYWLYGIGLVLVMVCGVKWNQIADVFQFPFSVIGSFTDVLSYIRLFAVGMSGACIAASFNGMAFDICQASRWLLPAGVLVVLFGHLLNIALAFLSVLVHAVRLNTLEFSNHTGLSWSGTAFHPFKQNTKS